MYKKSDIFKNCYIYKKRPVKETCMYEKKPTDSCLLLSDDEDDDSESPRWDTDEVDQLEAGNSTVLNGFQERGQGVCVNMYMYMYIYVYVYI